MDNVDVHRLFPSSPYQMAFTDEKLKDTFNKQMLIFKSSEAYLKLVDKYEFLN